jgi:hypothetical protein
MNLKDVVKATQEEMNSFGEKLTVDGDPGPRTIAAMGKFQLAKLELKLNDDEIERDEAAPKYWKPLVIKGVNVHPIFKVPAPYTHLHPYDFISHFMGQKEIPGSADNVLIAHTHEHSKNLGEHSDHNDYHDEVANCASGQNWVADGCGCHPAKGALAAHFDSYPGPRVVKGQLVKRGMLVRVAHPGGHITQAEKDFLWTGSGVFTGRGFNQGNTIKVSTYSQKTIVTVHDWLPLEGTVLAPIGTKALPATGGEGESTR